MLTVARLLLRHPLSVLTAMVVLVGVGVWQRTRLEESQSLEALVVRGDPRREVFERMRRDFGDDEILAVAVDAADVCRPPVLERIDRVTRWLAGLDGVGRVMGPTSVERLRVRALLGVPVVTGWEPVYRPGGGAAGARRLREYLETHPLYRRRLVSDDGRTALILVRFARRGREEINELTRRIQEGLGDFAGGGVRLYLAGFPLVRNELISAARRDVDRLLYVSLAVIVLVLACAFRRVMPVVLAAGVIVAGVVVATGAIAALGIRMNNLLSMVPALVLIIGSSTSMHLLTRYRVERARGADRTGAVGRALIHVGPGCFWASATTAVGFLGLLVSRVPALRQCGALSALGVALSFILALGLIPTVLTLGRRARGARRGWDPTPADLEPACPRSPVIDALGRFVERRAVLILLAAGAVAAACVYGITRLEVETNRLDYFRPTAPIRRAYRRIEEQFGGLTEIDVVVRGGSAGWLTPAALRRLDALQAALEEIDGVDYGLSLAALVKHLGQAFTGAYALPADDADLAAFLQLAASSGARFTSMFLSRDGRASRVVLFTRQKGSAHLADLIERIRRTARREAPPGTTVEVTGSAVVFAGMARYVVAGQVHGLLMVMGILLVIMAFLTGRPAAGLVCLAPTVVPILMLYGLMALTGTPLNIHTSIVSALAAGIAIDNAIHLLTAFKRSYRLTGDYAGSVRRAISLIGRPLVVNCLLIAGGLAAFTQAALVAVAQVGLLLGITMVNALVMGLLLLPALLLVLRPRIR